MSEAPGVDSGVSLVAAAPLAPMARRLRSGETDLTKYLSDLCDRVEAVDPEVLALLPEQGRRQRLSREAEALQRSYPDVPGRPTLFGVPVGIKDIFRVDGFETRCGSALPPHLFAGREAACVTRLRAAGCDHSFADVATGVGRYVNWLAAQA